MSERKVYLNNIPLVEAQEKFMQAISFQLLTKTEIVKVEEALGRVSATSIFAAISSPHYPSAAMDGFAVKSERTYGANEISPKRLTIGDEAFPIDTGNAIPKEFNAVIIIEDIIEVDGYIEINKPVAPWQHVRSIGEDIVATQFLFPTNHVIRPIDMGALLSGGVREVEVFKKPQVAIIPTGTELVEPGETLERGKIIESNSHIFSGLIKQWGGESFRSSPIPDDYNLIKEKVLEEAEKREIIIIGAGSSAGSKDYTASIVEEEGELLVHGVAIKPGKPVVLGIVKGVPVIGVPGFPVAAVIIMEQFIKPLIENLSHRKAEKPLKTKVKISRQVVSSLKSEEFLRVKIGEVDNNLVAVPLPRGSGVLMSLVQADGIVRIPQLKEGLKAGELVEVEMFKTMEDIKGTVICIGSHDLSLDILSQILQENKIKKVLSSAHVGSFGGIMSIKKGEAHIAGCHLLDEATGIYNLPYLKKLLPKEDLVVIKLVDREQGLIVKKNNPKNIKSLDDLVRKDMQFINRQKGAGTRVLLDFKLRELAILPEKISGYEKEEFNHLAVAAAVAGGSVDCGLGILAAAKAFNLDFVPLAWEEYSLIMHKKTFDTEGFQKILEVIRSNKFKERIEGLGGYLAKNAGEIAYAGIAGSWSS